MKQKGMERRGWSEERRKTGVSRKWDGKFRKSQTGV